MTSIPISYQEAPTCYSNIEQKMREWSDQRLPGSSYIVVYCYPLSGQSYIGIQRGFYSIYLIGIYGKLSNRREEESNYHTINCLEFQTFDDDSDIATYTYLFGFNSNSLFCHTWQLDTPSPTTISELTKEVRQLTHQVASLTSASQYYTYTLRYPDGTPFYVGKGQGDRVSQHVREVMSRSTVTNTIKSMVIQDIIGSGAKVVECIEVDGLLENKALQLESRLISAYSQSGLLTNASMHKLWCKEKHLCKLGNAAEGVSSSIV